MIEQQKEFICSDNWWIENDKAWFVANHRAILVCVNLKTNECEIAVKIPEERFNAFRVCQRCIKCKDSLFCLPDFGNCIWIYHLRSKLWKKVKIINPDKVRICILNCWIFDKRIFAIANGLKQIIEINIEKEEVEGYFQISELPEEKLGKSVLADGGIYVVSSVSAKVYFFNIKARKMNINIVPDIEDQLYQICYDGEKFWLGGRRKAIYIWDKKGNKTKTLSNLPSTFGNYNFSGKQEQLLDCDTQIYDSPAFIEIVKIGENLWFIPYQTNHILYVNQNECIINVFNISEEKESQEGLKKYLLAHMYLLDYIRDDRYLGIFSLKYEHLFEIDTKELKKQDRIISIPSCLLEEAFGHNFFDERIKAEKLIYKRLISEGKMNRNNKADADIGSKIFANI